MKAKHVNKPLLVGAFLCIFAALAHIGCIVFGASWYLALGAGQQMANLAEQGHWYPTLVTSVISFVLFVWALFALSGAGVIRHLPLTRWILVCIGLVLIVRGVLFVLLMPMFPGNSMTFWLVSSSLCALLGTLILFGTYQVWPQLQKRPLQ